MANYMSPLVDVREFDTTTTIPAVSTSIGVIILRDTYKGPEMKTQFVSSVTELTEIFGNPTTYVKCYQDMLAATGFLKYGSMLYCTRALSPSATFSGAEITSAGVSAAYTPYTLSTMEAATVNFGGDVDDFGSIEVSNFMQIVANSRGNWGNNIRIAIAGKSAYETCSAGVDSGLWANSTDSWSTSAAVGHIDTNLEDEHSFLVIVQTVAQGLSSTIPSTYGSAPMNWVTTEIFNVSLDPNAYDDSGRKRFAETMINESSNYIRVAVDEDTYGADYSLNILTSSWIYLAEGSDYYSDENLASDLTDTPILNALDLYSNPEEIDINIFIDSNKSDTVKSYMVDICEARKDSIAILDVPIATVVANRSGETDDLRTYITDTFDVNSSYACIYGNWIEVYDKWNGKYRWIPISGHIAGLFANNDNVAEPWFAPAGPNRALITSVRRLGWNPDLAKRNILYKNNINPVVSLSGMGKLVYGQKTMLKRDSAFNRINIRRLFMVLEKAIATAARYFLFEPNDDISRLLLVNMIDPFLRDVKARRGIYDYLVVCNETNNTPERIDRGEIWCDIFIKPTHAAEYIVLNFISTKTGTNFSEIGGIAG